MFASIVMTRRNNNGRYSAVTDELLQKNYPIGWALFAHTNITMLQQTVANAYPSFSSTQLFGVMRQVYYAMKKQYNEALIAPHQVTGIVKELNDLVLSSMATTASQETKRLEAGIALNKGIVPIEKRPSSLNSYDKGLYRSDKSMQEVKVAHALVMKQREQQQQPNPQAVQTLSNTVFTEVRPNGRSQTPAKALFEATRPSLL